MFLLSRLQSNPTNFIPNVKGYTRVSIIVLALTFQFSTDQCCHPSCSPRRQGIEEALELVDNCREAVLNSMREYLGMRETLKSILQQVQYDDLLNSGLDTATNTVAKATNVAVALATKGDATLVNLTPTCNDTMLREKLF